MKLIRLSLLRIALPVLLVLSMLAVPRPAFALAIITVQPNVVSSVSSVDLVITGTDFVDGAVVTLNNYGALTTSFVSATVLSAMVPAGLAPGSYTVTVTNPDSTSASLPNGLRVEDPTVTPAYTSTSGPPEEDETPTPFLRPLVVVDSYKASAGEITAGLEFDLVLKLGNAGHTMATNIVLTFTTGDFVPRVTGGVLAAADIEPDETHRFEQPLRASNDIIGKSIATQTVQITYTDLNGASYSETFNLTLPVAAPRYGPAPTVTPTPTTAPSMRPQLVINNYGTDVSILQPGSHFNLDMTIQNVGNATARRVTMILGGGSSASGGTGGTPDPGGVSGGTGDFGNFAPVASSNVQFVGDVAAGSSFSAKANLIVNATTNPGAYPMKISFTYVGDNNISFTDDQVVTLLVYSLPQVEVNFYRDPGPLFTGQPNQLPFQVVNLGRKTTVLGNMRITAESADITNNVTLVGALDPGGYFTLDAMAVPFQPGPLDMLVTIDYTDDFNQSQTITRTVSVEVLEAPVVEPPPDGAPGGPDPAPLPAEPETFVQKVWRFVRGMLGLDSGVPTPAPELPPGEMPPGEVPPGEVPPGGKPVPLGKG